MKIVNYSGLTPYCSNRALLEASPFGLYTVVPAHPEIKSIAPGVIFCLRQKTGSETTDGAASTQQINPLQPYFLVYMLADGNVRYGFAHPKQILGIYRELCAGRTAPYETLCTLFDHETQDGHNMDLYNTLLEKAVGSIAATFSKRVASGLQTGRSFVIPNRNEQANETTDFELITWLVIKAEG